MAKKWENNPRVEDTRKARKATLEKKKKLKNKFVPQVTQLQIPTGVKGIQ